MLTTTDTSTLIGDHPAMDALRALIAKVAPTSATILITGESGTGKELVARALHARSLRADGPFVPVNCAAIPAELLESELFGHERGAFTGAVARRAGMFHSANGGTIFLDEVGEMTPLLQIKLLRVLQDGVVRRVGADQPSHVDVRVIAATNKDPVREVAQGTFREDLYYRLQVVPIAVPPLRERASDVPVLTAHFLARHNRSRADHPLTISEDVMALLFDHDWPGNVRELEHLLERVVILADDATIGVEQLPLAMRSGTARKKVAAPSSHGLDLKRSVAAFELDLIEQALQRTHGNKQKAARLLGLKRTTLVAKIHRREMPPERAAVEHGAP